MSQLNGDSIPAAKSGVVSFSGWYNGYGYAVTMLAAKAKHAKVVFVGDCQQLLPVGVGNAFSAMTENEIINTVRLDEIRRQKDAELLRGVQESVIGDIENSFQILEKNTHTMKNIKNESTLL